MRDFLGDTLAADVLSHTWDCDNLRIRNRWIEGHDGIVFHSDHGRPRGWWHPPFLSTDLRPHDTSGGPWYPLVLSINCSSGYFDSESDLVWLWDQADGIHELVENTDTWPGYDHWPTHDECFCEMVLRQPYGGGIAAIGGSRGTDAGKNDKLVDGLFAAMYADYDRGVVLLGPGTRRPCEYLGDVLRTAKQSMYTYLLSPIGPYESQTQADYNMEAYHLFGDPMLRIRPPQPPPGAD